MLNFDLNVTQQCNMRCAYCVESGMYNTTNCEKILPDFLNFIDKILAHTDKNVKIGFWGGEPTLRADLMLDVVERYELNPRVAFMMYCNGYKMPDRLASMLLRLKDVRVEGEPKFFSQFSYDGLPVHDIKRRTTQTGQATSEEVRSTILWAKESKIPFSLKATLTMDTLKYLSDAYTDVNALLLGSESYFGVGYFPTLDYFNDIQDDLLETHISEMCVNLKKIAVMMLSAQKEGKPYSPFRWFDATKADCNAGVELFSVDTDGKIYVCHGCFYSPKKEDHLLGCVTDDISILEKSAKKHAPVLHLNPTECSTCEAMFCVRCNVIRYSVSEKLTYEDRWKDYTNNLGLCRIYKEAGKVARAYHKILKTLR